MKDGNTETLSVQVSKLLPKTHSYLNGFWKEITDNLHSGYFKWRMWFFNESQSLIYVYEPSTKLNTMKLGSNKKIPNPITKRAILSNISQIFDSLGLLSPCIILAKILLDRFSNFFHL